MFPQPPSEKDGLCWKRPWRWKASRSCSIPAQGLPEEMQWWQWTRWSSSVWHGDFCAFCPSPPLHPSYTYFLVSSSFLCLLVHWKELAFGSIGQFSPLASKILLLNARVHAPKYCLSLLILPLGPWCLFGAFSPALPCHPLKLQWNPFFLVNEYSNTGLSSLLLHLCMNSPNSSKSLLLVVRWDLTQCWGYSWDISAYWMDQNDVKWSIGWVGR